MPQSTKRVSPVNANDWYPQGIKIPLPKHTSASSGSASPASGVAKVVEKPSETTASINNLTT